MQHTVYILFVISNFLAFKTIVAQQEEQKSAPKVTISGYVEDAISQERLIGVSIEIAHQPNVTLTNNFGFFSLTLPQSAVSIKCNYMGYKPFDTLIRAQNDLQLTIHLQPDRKVLDEVVITSESGPDIAQNLQMSKRSLSAEDIQSMPKFLGESDVLKVLQLMPGVQQGSDGTAAILVRGGSPDQNYILLDGVPLYKPAHLLGIVSTFNTSIIKQVDLYKGAFPARFGGRISSVMDISTKDGNMRKIHGDFSMGILASKLTLEGPLKKEKTSFVFSGRRSYGDLFIRPLMKLSGGSQAVSLYFYDLNLKIQHRFSDNDRLFLNVYGGKDKFGLKERMENYETETGIRWGNYLGAIRWNHIFSPQLFSNVTLWASDFSLGIEHGMDTKTNNKWLKDRALLSSGIRDIGAKIDLDYHPYLNHVFKFGGGLTYHSFLPGKTIQEQGQGSPGALISETNAHRYNAVEMNLFTEDEWAIFDKLQANVGIHFSGFSTENVFYSNLQPRISLRYLLPGDWGLMASYSRMVQYLHLLAGNSLTLPTDLWVPATETIKPQTAHQTAIGVTRNVFSPNIELSVEGYYKTINNVIEYRDGAAYILSGDKKDWQEQVASGTAIMYGAEIMLRKKEGRLAGWIAYSIATSDRTIPEVNFGKTFPYKYDRRHDFKAVVIYKLKPSIELSANWVYQSAAPFTMPEGQYEVAEPDEEPSLVRNITQRNNARLEAYHRLDIGINFKKKQKNGNIRTWNLSVYNLYNRKNPFYYYTDINTNGTMQVTKLSLLPILPSVSYNLKF